MINKLGASASEPHGHHWPGDIHMVIHHQNNNMSIYWVIRVTYTELQGACLLLQQLIDRCKVTKESVPQLTAKVSNLISTPMTFDEVC